MADTVTMDASHYEKMQAKAAGHRAEGMYGEWGLTVAKKNQVAFATLIGGAVGWYFLSNKSWSDKIALFREHWWLKPLLVLVAGWYLWRRQNKYATIVLALGAALFAQAWRAYQNKTAKPGEVVDTGDAESPYAWDAGSGTWVPSGQKPEEVAQQVFDSRRAA